jgi:hypothetical protein
MAAKTSKPIAKGAGKQFAGKAPLAMSPKQATAAMQGRDPPAAKSTSITRKDGRKNNFKSGGKKPF